MGKFYLLIAFLAILFKILSMTKQIFSALILLVLDQFTKQWAQNTLPGNPQPFLEYSQNTGIAFGLPLPQPLLILAVFILIPLLIYIARQELNLKKPLAQAVLVLILTGAIGNLIDRFIYGYVIDFINLGPWPNFNLADVYITTAVLLVVLFYGKISRTNKQK